MARQRDNLKAGIFVMVGTALAVAIVFALSDVGAYFEKQQTIKVSFTLPEGLHGLKVGSAVTLGDDPIGRVTNIQDVLKPGSDGNPRVTGILVLCRIPARIHLYQDAVVDAAEPLLGTDTRLNIESVGTAGPYSAAAAAPDDRLSARPTVSLGATLENAGALTTDLRRELPHLTAKAQQVLDEAQPVVEQLKATLADLKQAAADTRAMVAQARAHSGPWIEHIDRAAASADQSLASVDSLLKDKDPAIRQSIDNAKQITQSIRDKTLAEVTEALDRANHALEDFQKTGEQVRGLVTGQRPILERAFANAELTTDQLKLASIEIRRSPWRLLYRPNKKELNSDNLYDAARSFALAASSLDSASKSLQAVAVAQPRDQQQVDKMVDYLESLCQRFEQTEDAFWKALKNQAGPPSKE